MVPDFSPFLLVIKTLFFWDPKYLSLNFFTAIATPPLPNLHASDKSDVSYYTYQTSLKCQRDISLKVNTVAFPCNSLSNAQDSHPVVLLIISFDSPFTDHTNLGSPFRHTSKLQVFLQLQKYPIFSSLSKNPE